MDNQNNANPSTDPTNPPGGSFPPAPDPGNLTVPTPGSLQSAPSLDQTPPAGEPGLPTPLSSLPSWPPAPAPTPPAAEPHQSASFPSPSWPQETASSSLSSGMGNSGMDLNSAWNPSPSAPIPSTTPEPVQTPPGETAQTPPPLSANPWLNPQPSVDPLSTPQTPAWQTPVPEELQPNPDQTPFQPDPPQTPAQPEPNLPLAQPTPPQPEITAPPDPFFSPSGTALSQPAPVLPEPLATFTPPPPNSPDNINLAAVINPAASETPAAGNTFGVNSVQPSWTPDSQTATVPSTPTEAAPTDLSHLISGNQPETPAKSSAENLVMPTTGVNVEVPNLPAQARKGIPRWLIGVGVGLLIMVAGASAYFILGVGQSKPTTSLPATVTEEESNQIKPPLPITSASTEPSPAAGGSANFGQLEGNTPQQTASGSSSLDLLRQRQQEGI